MAIYNSWQNQMIFGAAKTLSDAERKADRGAFFRSIHGTLNHLLWGDQIWMSRFSNVEAPAAAISASPNTIEDWENVTQLAKLNATTAALIKEWEDDDGKKHAEFETAALP